jgi:uncharacterized membrane protein
MSDAGSVVQMAPPGAAAAAACGVALVSLGPVVLHQSKAAHPFGVPDGLLGVASYGATMALLLAARGQPKVRPLLAVKLAGDAGFAGFNVVRQIVQFRRVCSWCMLTALATGVMVYAGRKMLTSAVDEALPASK